MANPTLSGLSSPSAYLENTVNSTPQLLFGSVTFSDADDDFNGGTLKVSGLLTEDRVSISNSAVIYLTSGTVYYDADGAGAGSPVAIGTASGGVGSTFTVTFNSSATSAAIDALIERLSYADVSDTPTASRTLNIDVVDAAGHHINQLAVYEQAASNPFSAVSTVYHAAPALADLDQDGDLDLLVGRDDGAFDYFENTGSASSPTFTQRTGSANPMDGADVGMQAVPNFVDLDNDGDLDLAVGEKYGAMKYFLNTGTSSAPAYTQQTGSANPWNGVNIGGYGAPAFGDLDGDGDYDLVIGQELGTYRYFQNTGSASSPSFTEITGSSNPFNAIAPVTWFDNWAHPYLVDMDGDGDLDMLSGDTWGSFHYYENTGSTSAPVFTERTGSGNPMDGVRLYFGSAPFVADLDNDGDLDIVAGDTNAGLVTYFQGHHGQNFTVQVTAEDDPMILTGTSGNDTLNGASLNDSLSGLGGDDTLNSYAGNDVLDGGTGADTMTGGTGDDTYYVDNTGDTVVENSGEGADIVRTTVSFTLAANVENMVLDGSSGISGTGNASVNAITGNAGANTIDGLAGDDVLKGMDGNDTIYGGTGADIMVGGNGSDTFVIRQESVGQSHLGAFTLEIDTVNDLVAANGDKLDLSAIDADTNTAGDQAFTLVGSFTSHAGEMTLAYSSGVTTLQLDVDGDGSADYRMKISGDVHLDSGGWIL